MPIQRSHYDTTKDGQEIDRYVLSNNNQYEVHIITYGGIITNIFAPDKEGLREDVVLGLDTYEGKEETLDLNIFKPPSG
ncbi:hypothetical protein DPMN_087735 [Dreissena polymorpha]|uniref:Aldose 1-epimerase n=1 Tax=Dreissena polymorpha TaxID=45954 RepID=A0A9D4KTI4_DREPO|nr:hypothetical protein DPMN_087735 [Dreissena polymorpha]